ncbi:MAG: hypothetical protein GDA53_06240 [Rhodobacteraceae bacterium]|nr:hypothetical protein [Paracoccaceae bacterium]
MNLFEIVLHRMAFCCHYGGLNGISDFRVACGEYAQHARGAGIDTPPHRKCLFEKPAKGLAEARKDQRFIRARRTVRREL